MTRYKLIDGYLELKVKQVPKTKRRAAHLVVRCGCCKTKIDIYPIDPIGGGMEIGGVLGSVRNWRAILLPLLRTSLLRKKG